MSTTHTGSVITSLARAIESRDADAILSHYAADATLTVHDKDHPPADPQVLTGHADIGAYYRDVCGRNIEHDVRDADSSSTGLAYVQHCRYPDGTKVVCTTVAALEAGLIVRQTASQTWDEG